MNILQTILLWLFLNILIVIAMQLSLFMQTTDAFDDASMIEKIITSEFWATMQWVFVIPAQRLGILFLNPAQLAMSSYIFNFVSQIFSNAFWLKIHTTIDDYIGMIIILSGLYFAKFKIFG